MNITHYLISSYRNIIYLGDSVVVVYHVTIVVIGHGLLKKFWPIPKQFYGYVGYIFHEL